MFVFLLSLAFAEFRICIYNTDDKDKLSLSDFISKSESDVKTYLQNLEYDMNSLPNINIDYPGHTPQTSASHQDSNILEKFTSDDFHPMIIFDSMQETPSTEITHAPSGGNSSSEYHGYILRFPGQFNARSFHVYNCKDKGDKIDGFNILNYIGPMNLIISLDNADIYYVLWNVNLTGEESGYTSGTSNKIYETRALSFSNVNNYTSVQISDGYTTTSFLATVKFDSFTFQFQIPYDYSSLVLSLIHI